MNLPLLRGAVARGPRWMSVLGVSALLTVTLHAVDPGKPSVSALEVTAYRAIGAKHPDRRSAMAIHSRNAFSVLKNGKSSARLNRTSC